MNFCRYCQQPCGEREFCDDTCYGEHRSELNALEQEIAEDYPGESRYVGDFGEPEEWDVIGGL
jgi:hypothetical protein